MRGLVRVRVATLGLLALLAPLAGGGAMASRAVPVAASIPAPRVVHSVLTEEFGLSRPGGVAYSAATKSLLVVATPGSAGTARAGGTSPSL